jgi:FtsP/CotA-like multicopper oxidase with cupredoxin domain
MWNEMRMSPTDLADLSAATLTYLMNGTTPAGNWTGLFRPGERLRLRFVNGAGNSFYDVRIPGLKMTVVQADGLDIERCGRRISLRPGETYDVIVERRTRPTPSSPSRWIAAAMRAGRWPCVTD